MFDHISIHFSGPICKCNQQNLSWCQGLNEINEIHVYCETCHIRLIIPFKSMRFFFDKQYPEGEKKKDNIFRLIEKEN